MSNEFHECADVTRLEKALYAIFSLPIWLTCGWLMLFSAPSAERLFASVRMNLPYAFDFVITWGWLAVPVVLLAAGLVGLRAQRRWSVYLALVVVPVILSAFLFVSIYVPVRDFIAGARVNIDPWSIIWG